MQYNTPTYIELGPSSGGRFASDVSFDSMASRRIAGCDVRTGGTRPYSSNGPSASALVYSVIVLLFFAWTSRGMSKRYVKRYTKTAMSSGMFAMWTAELVANGLTGGVLGLVYDLTYDSGGSCPDSPNIVMEDK